MPDETEDSGDHGHIPVLLDRCVELLAPGAHPKRSRWQGRRPHRRHPWRRRALRALPHRVSRLAADRPGSRSQCPLDRRRAAVQVRRPRPAGAHPLRRHRGRARRKPVTGQARRRHGILFDLGVSSMQLDRTERGFSYASDAPLDMRMDPDAPLTAAEVLNTYDERALARLLREFGEERFASRIASQIARRRASRPFTTTAELVELLYQAIPAPARRTGGHPAKRTFQALRIAVNGELDSLRDALPAALEALTPGGRIVVMAYQSLEDRIVKNQFAAATASKTPPGLPVELPGHEPEFVALTRGAERAGAEEIALNPRSASVRLRALEKVGESDEGASRPSRPSRSNGRHRHAGTTSADATPETVVARVRHRRGASPPATSVRGGRRHRPIRPRGPRTLPRGRRTPARPRRGPRHVKPRRPRSSGLRYVSASSSNWRRST